MSSGLSEAGGETDTNVELFIFDDCDEVTVASVFSLVLDIVRS